MMGAAVILSSRKVDNSVPVARIERVRLAQGQRAAGLVDLDIWPNEMIALLGKRPSEAALLFDILVGRERPLSGRYQFRGREVGKADKYYAGSRTLEIEGLATLHSLNDHQTIGQSIEASAMSFEPDARRSRARAIASMDRVAIAHRANEFPSNLDPFSRARAKLAHAIVINPTMLMAEAPTAELSPAEAVSMMEILHSLLLDRISVVLLTNSSFEASFASREIGFANGVTVELPSA